MAEAATGLERAARALCRVDDEDPDELIEMLDDTFAPRWEFELVRARAVLDSIREPGSAIAAAARGITDPACAWRKMVDAQLADKG